MTRRTYIAVVAALTIVACVRVASTHRVFNATVDEPVHLAAGWLWLNGSYNIDLGHPPLARVLAAMPFELAGVPDPPPADDTSRGNFLLYHGDRYEKHLARARMGNLLLFIVAILAVAALARRTFGRGISVLAVALFTNVPAVLAHAGLMTTDMAVTAALPLAILALDMVLDAPTWRRAIGLGAAIGMGVLAKFSFLVFFPAAVIVLIAVRWKAAAKPPHSRVLVALVVAFFVIWGGYRFDFRPISTVFKGASFFIQMMVPESMRQSVRDFSDNVPIPAPALPIGIGVLKEHDKHGHQTFLLGETGMKGWWYYFPVVFFFKTPIPFLILVAFGLSRRGIEHALIPLAILLVSMTGSINIGVRHVLPMYPFLSIVAAFGTAELWRRTRGAFATLSFAALMAWLFIGVAAAHPDYLAWFEAAGKRPWRIAADSNLDWGQDVLRLERAMRELKIERVWIRYSASVDLERHGIRSDNLPDHPVSGWIVLGETPITFFPDRVAWLTERYEPVRRIGKSMRLYYVP